MSLFSFFKYSARERKMARTVASWFLAGSYPASDAKDLSYLLLDKCISEAEQKGLRTVTDLGDRVIAGENFMKKRLEAGLTVEDVRNAWNAGYVWVRLQEEASNDSNFPIYKLLVEEQGLSSKDAVNTMRRAMPYFGDPETSHADYQGEDADNLLRVQKPFRPLARSALFRYGSQNGRGVFHIQRDDSSRHPKRQHLIVATWTRRLTCRSSRRGPLVARRFPRLALRRFACQLCLQQEPAARLVLADPFESYDSRGVRRR